MKMKRPNKKAVKNYKKPVPNPSVLKVMREKAKKMKKPTKRSPKKY